MRDGDRLAVYHPEFLEDLQYWVETDRRTAKRLLKVVRATFKNPFDGIGKPEPLKYLGSNVWSRRITQENRCVYLIKFDRVEFLQGQYQYRTVCVRLLSHLFCLENGADERVGSCFRLCSDKLN